ncbi:MAG: tRNA dihydrouridine synthase DusB [Bifidobacteriaceae bacterium]|jgi:nifR3 family TIM-barrel protein|nr:tRNA dihydrouridine synthase DusB [Bifidobacteriaceae bacterium]
MLPNYRLALSPMAGVTNSPYRRLCQEFYKEAFYVGEMVNARSLIENNCKAKKMVVFSKKEKYRSLQIFSKFPDEIFEVVRKIVAENIADHVDLNFGCPVKKITQNGGGAMILTNLDLYKDIIQAAVLAAKKKVPITCKFRIGTDEKNQTYIQAGEIAEEQGCSLVTLHARYMKQMYKGQADWSKIADLKNRLSIKVFGNGDVRDFKDAKRMFEVTGVDGIAIGRAALGKPWIFEEIAQNLGWKTNKYYPKNYFDLKKIKQIVLYHTDMLIEYYSDENQAVKLLRKFLIWYFKGFSIGSDMRMKLVRVANLDDVKYLLKHLDEDK